MHLQQANAGESFAAISYETGSQQNAFRLSFRADTLPPAAEGAGGAPLLYIGGAETNSFIALTLRPDGRIALEFDCGTGINTLTTEQITLGGAGDLFHTVVVTREGTSASVRVDDVVVSTTGAALPCQLDTDGNVYLGGRAASDKRRPVNQTPLDGCMREVTLDGRTFSRGDLTRSVAVGPCTFSVCPRASALPGTEVHRALAAAKRLAEAEGTVTAASAEFSRVMAVILASADSASSSLASIQATEAVLKSAAFLDVVSTNAQMLQDLQALASNAGTATAALQSAAAEVLQRARGATESAAATAAAARAMHDEWAPATALAVNAQAAAEQALATATQALSDAQARFTLTQQVQAAAATITTEAAAAQTALSERLRRVEAEMSAGAEAVAALEMPTSPSAFQARVDALNRQFADSEDTSLEVLAEGQDVETRSTSILAAAQPLASGVDTPLAAFDAPEASLATTRSDLETLQAQAATSVRQGALLQTQAASLSDRLTAAAEDHAAASATLQAASVSAAQARAITDKATGLASDAQRTSEEASGCHNDAIDAINDADTRAVNVDSTLDAQVTRFNTATAGLASRVQAVNAGSLRAEQQLGDLAALRSALAEEEAACRQAEERVQAVAQGLQGLSPECLLDEP